MTSADLLPLANHLWQSTLCIGVVWLAALVLKKNRAAVRYWLWFAASAKFVIPFAPLVALGARLTWRMAPAIAQPQWSLVMDDVATPFAASLPMVHAVAPHGSPPIPAILIGVWLCGLAAGIVFWIRCSRNMRSVRSLATPLPLGLPIPVMSSPSRIEPGVFGILRPVLLLPEGIADRLTPPQLDAILAHEMCHVRRRDNLTAAIHMFVETVFWFHPLVWWIRTRLIEEREGACDEEVIRLGSDPETYAEGIIGVCKSYIESPVACVSGISGSDLKKRIICIVTRRLGVNLPFSRKLLLVAIGIALVTGPLVFGIVNAPLLRAQSSAVDWEKAAGGAMSFDVASVKQNKSGPPPSGDNPMANFPLDNGDGYSSNGGRLSVTNFPLFIYINFAYKLTGAEGRTLQSQLPKWATTDQFDIEARAPANTTKDQMRLMMQSLLADRFKLSLHFETQQLPVFGLVLVKPGKTGPQLRSHSEGPPCDPVTPAPSDSVPAPKANAAEVFPPTCGALTWDRRALSSGHVRIGFRNATMEQIAGYLATAPMAGLDRPVLDQTGLSGNLDFTMDYTRDSPLGAPGADQQSDTSGPTFLEALRDQLGAKLEPQKGPVVVLVIDHIEEPSPN